MTGRLTPVSTTSAIHPSIDAPGFNIPLSGGAGKVAETRGYSIPSTVLPLDYPFKFEILLNPSVLWNYDIVPVDLARNLVFPGASLLQRPVEVNGAGAGAIDDAAATVPAFIGMKNDGRIAFHGIGYVNVYLTDVDTFIATDTYLRVEYDLGVRSSDVRQRVYLFPWHYTLLIRFYRPRYNPCCRLRNWLSYRPSISRAVPPFQPGRFRALWSRTWTTPADRFRGNRF